MVKVQAKGLEIYKTDGHFILNGWMVINANVVCFLLVIGHLLYGAMLAQTVSQVVRKF
jgi:hypothetical protein